MRPLLGTFRRLPGGLIGMLALVVLVEGWLGRHELQFGNVSAREWGLSAREARTRARDVDLLCLGDSLILGGVQPRVLRERLGLTAYNLAVPAAQASTTYFLLRRALEAGARPGAVVVGFSPFFLGVGPDHVIDRWPLLIGLREAIDLGRTAGDLSLAGRMIAARQLPSLRNRFELRIAVRLAFAGASFNTAGTYLTYARNRRTNDGATVGARRSGPDPDPDPGDLILVPYRCRVKAVNRVYMRRFFELTRAHGLPVYWVLSPYLPVIRDRRLQRGVEAEYTAFVRATQDRYPQITVIDARESGYPTSVFADMLHLDRDGSSVLSADIADAIGESDGLPNAAPRWIRLPEYRPREIRPDLEDFEQSKMALQRAWKTTRR